MCSIFLLIIRFFLSLFPVILLFDVKTFAMTRNLKILRVSKSFEEFFIRLKFLGSVEIRS